MISRRKEGIDMKRAAVLAVFCMFIASHCAAESPRETSVVKVVREWAPSVVNISTERLVRLGSQQFWGAYGKKLDKAVQQHAAAAAPTMKLKGVGSGVIVSKEGLIITNAHVVNMTSKVYVILNDGTAYEAKVAGISQPDDIAVLAITPSKPLRAVRFADDVIIGETVVSIGNPLGLENSVSAGIVSGTNRVFRSGGRVAYDGLIQVDASINQGSSGGALFNLEGGLAGINLAVIQSAQSIGFAIPASKVKKILERYRELASRKEMAGT